MNISPNRLIIATGASLLLVFLVYTALWFWMTKQIRVEIDRFISEAQKEEITVVTRILEIRGYPFTPKILFSGRLSKDDTVIEVPELLVQSLLLPNKPIKIYALQGLSILEPADTAIWSLDSLRIDGIIPKTLPPALFHEDLSVWKETGGNIQVDHIELKKQDLTLTGAGTLFLDDTLQPAGELSTRMTGYLDFLFWLQQNGYVETREALLATTVLTGLSRTDKNGETSVNADLTLQNRTLFVGPLRVVKLPMIVWNWRHQPGRPQ